jgi:predicted ATPase
LPEVIEEKDRAQKKILENITTQVKEIGKENLRKRQKKETTSDNYKWASIIENLNKYKFKFIEDFFTQLNDFKNSISFLLQNQNKEIKRHYFSSDSDNINSLFYNYGKRIIENKGIIDYPAKDFFEKWLGYSEGFNIADKIDIQEISTPYNDELIGISYYLKNQNTLSPLGDNGLGINNFVSLLLQIVSTYKSTKKSILILEEPETGFHPAFQSKLADLLVEAHEKFEINFIIETHSEYFIRKLQFLIAKKELNKENVIIYYFNSPYNDKIPKGKNQIKALEVNEDGSLTGNFGTGFFDEADNIAIELYRIQKKNLN